MGEILVMNELDVSVELEGTVDSVEMEVKGLAHLSEGWLRPQCSVPNPICL